MNSSKDIESAYLQSLQVSQYKRTTLETIIESIALGSLFLFSFAANGVICTVLFQPNRRQTVTNILLHSLVFSNVFLSVFIFPFVISSVVANEWVFGGVWCEISGFLVTCLTTASIFCIVAIAIHRYYIVVKPLAFKIDLQKANRIVGFLWFSAVTCSAPPIFGWNSYIYSGGKAGCTILWSSSGPSYVYVMYYVMMTYIIPLIIILLVYRSIYAKAKKQRKLDTFLLNGTNGHVGANRFDQNSRMCSRLACCSSAKDIVPNPTNHFSTPADRRRKATSQISLHSAAIQQRTFQSASVIVLSFLICLSPYYVFNIWTSIKHSDKPIGILDFSTTWLYYCMTAVNPMTYGYSNRQIRRAVKRLPVMRHIFRQGRDRAYQMDPGSVFSVIRKNAVQAKRSRSNDALELSERY